MKALLAKIAANVVARVRPAATAALAVANVVPAVRAVRVVVVPKVQARVGRVVMDQDRRGKVAHVADFLGTIVAIKWNAANRRSLCRRLLPALCRTKRASNPWPAR